MRSSTLIIGGGGLLWLAACRADDRSAPPGPARVVVEAPPPSAPARGGDEVARADAVRSRYTKYEYRIPMRDGVRLFTAVYVPNDASEKRRYPFLIERTPYSVGPYGAGRYATALGPDPAYDREGFIFVHQDVRGAHMSEGQFVDVRPHRPGKRGPAEIDESSDTYDTIAWLLKNVQMAFSFYSGFERPRPKPTDDREWKLFEYGTPDAYQFYLDQGRREAR